jgi:hypothetical protein
MQSYLSMYNNNTYILPLMVFCLEKDTITIPHTKSNLYSVPKFIVIKSQKGLLTRNEVVAREQLCLQTDDDNDIVM